MKLSSIPRCGAIIAVSLLLSSLPGFAAGQNDMPANSKNQISTFYPLATGNGFGFAVLATTGEVTRFYAHPYRFERPNTDPTKDGPDSANFIKSMSWRGDNANPEIKYLAETQVISAKSKSSENLFFMPFALKRNGFIAIRRSSIGDNKPVLQPVWQHTIEKEELKETGGRKVLLLKFHDVNELLAVVSLDKKTADPPKAHELNGSSWAFLVLGNADELDKAITDLAHWQGDQNANALVDREVKDFESWRIKPAIHFASENERHLWRQQEAILRISQIQEENNATRFNHGLILASLPDGVWFTPWVRDMSYALVGLVRMGHYAEAREGILSWLNAHPVARWKQETRNLDYQISVVRYYGDGSEESDYSGQKTPNVEFDDWGLALWAISDYWQNTHDNALLSVKTYRGDTVYESMRDYIVMPLLGNLDKYNDGLIVAEDSSCWEEHQENKRHYACSTIAAIPGLRGFLKIAEHMHDDASVSLVKEKLKLLNEGFKSAFVKDGMVRGVLETDTQPKSELDGAVLETFNLGIVEDPSIAEKTIDRLQKLKTASGGYRRNTGPSNYEAHEFLLIDFNMARLLFKLGRTAEAAAIINTIVDKSCQDHGLIPEMYVSAKGKDSPGEIGDPAGSIPMVGFGAGDFAITLADRERYAKHGN